MEINDIGLKNGYVELSSNRPNWKNYYQQEEVLIRNSLKKCLIMVEHVGSTSIRSIKAKPIIDILVVIKQAFITAKADKILNKIGYEKGLFQRKGEIFYLKSINDIHTHYIHLVKEKEDWQRYILFRDYLNSNPEIATSYEEIKLKLANIYFDNRKEYTASKEAFVENILSKLR
jgi:GrpB-like predicted nucleotidyltransferase (UPF0157 family)